MSKKKKIIRDIQEGYQDMYRAWKNAGKKIKTNKKKSYWDTDNGNS